MKQKIVVKVQMSCGKCRKESMKIAATADGVISVTLQGNDKDEIVVVGNKVDSAGLCTALRKKVGNATLVSVQEVKDPKPEENDNNKKKGDDQNPNDEGKKTDTNQKLAEEKEETKKQEEKNNKEKEKDQQDQSKQSEAKPPPTEAVAALAPPPPPMYHPYPPPPPNYCCPNPHYHMYAIPVDDNHDPGCVVM